jgi:hypothetical protein
MAISRMLAATPNGPIDKCSFKNEDFFSLSDDDKFDLIYDFTLVEAILFSFNLSKVPPFRFFVAIHPSRRPEWARKMHSLCKPGGYLITLIFPLDPPQDYGPPFFVRPEHYVEVMGSEHWEKVVDKVPEVSSESHVGRERLVVWRRL